MCCCSATSFTKMKLNILAIKITKKHPRVVDGAWCCYRDSFAADISFSVYFKHEREKYLHPVCEVLQPKGPPSLSSFLPSWGFLFQRCQARITMTKWRQAYCRRSWAPPAASRSGTMQEVQAATVAGIAAQSEPKNTHTSDEQQRSFSTNLIIELHTSEQQRQ